MALVVNNLGGTSVLELNIIARAAVIYLSKLICFSAHLISETLFVFS